MEASPVLEWLFESTLYITVFVCFIFIIKAVMRGKLPAWWSYGLWLILLLRMIIPWDISPLSILNLFDTTTVNDVYRAFLLEPVTSVPLNRDAGAANTDKILLSIWLIGVGCFSVSTLLKNLLFWKAVRTINPVDDRDVLDLFKECRILLGVSKNIQIIETGKVKSPGLFGYFKPRLLLPPDFLGSVKKDELCCVFYHELGHLKCHDIAVSWLSAFLQVIHWFNPFVWYAFRHMRLDQEASCDAFVLSRINRVNPADYANTIVDLLERFIENRQLPSLAGIIENRSQIRRRIKMIMNFKKHTNRITLVSILILFAVGFVFFTSSSGFSGEDYSGDVYESSDDADDDSKAYKMNEIDEYPRVLRQILPKFPYEALEAGVLKGKVMIRLVIGKDGLVNEPTVLKAEPEGFFEEAALDSVADNVYQPAYKGGKPVNCVVIQPINFIATPDDLKKYDDIKNAEISKEGSFIYKEKQGGD